MAVERGGHQGRKDGDILQIAVRGSLTMSDIAVLQSEVRRVTVRALVNLTLSAIKLLGQQQVETRFVRDEAEALVWIEGLRAQHTGGAT